MEYIIKTWNGRTIRQREDGYLSLTDMAQACGKLVGSWLRLKATEEYLKALSSNRYAEMHLPKTEVLATDLIEVIQGGIPSLQGTWGHPHIAKEFGRWCLLPKRDKSQLGVLYVCQDTGNNAYKIGYTTNIKKRQERHHTSNPFLELIKVYKDVTIDFEALIHLHLAKYRIPKTTEWYVKHRDVLSVINLHYSDYIKSQEDDPRFGKVGMYPDEILVEVFKNA